MLVREIGRRAATALALAGDVQSEQYAKDLVSTAAVKSYGRLDVAFNNAGTLGPIGPSTEVDLAAWNEALAVNLTSAFLGAKHHHPGAHRRRRRLDHLHLYLRRPYGELSRRRGLCGEQIGADRPDPDPGGGIRRAGRAS